MIDGDSILVSLVTLVDHLPWPPQPDKRPRGCPRRYSERLIMQALLIMIIRRLYSAYALLRFLEQDDPVVRNLRPLLVEQGRFPSRRTWERRLAKLPETLPGLIGSSGRHLVAMLKPWAQIVERGEVSWIYEADIVSFFDSLDRNKLKEMLGIRVADGSRMRLIGKCLHVGVLDGDAVWEPELGTAQGSVLSPLLGNVYLHYVLDLWFETEVKPRLQGKATLIRYWEDVSIGFEREDAARRVVAARQTDGALRTGSASGQDSPATVSAPAEVATEGERSGHV
jgi:hypothetical protein